MENNKEVYYTVGLPIKFTVAPGFLDRFSLKATYEDVPPNFRDTIPGDELTASYTDKKLTDVFLFKTESEALEYSRSLRVGKVYFDEILAQPAVFKVQYLGEKTFENDGESLSIVINSDGPKPNPIKKESDLDKRSLDCKALKVTKLEALLVSGKLKVQNPTTGFKEYEEIDFTQPKNQQSCNVM